MVQRTQQILFVLLSSANCGTKLTEEERNLYSPDLLSDLLKILSKHDVAHLSIFGLKENELISKEQNDIEKYIFKAFYHYERLRYKYEVRRLKKQKFRFFRSRAWLSAGIIQNRGCELRY